MQKNLSNIDWAPSCSIEQLQLRAKLLIEIRSFFNNAGVLEVETPLLCSATGTDPNLNYFKTEYSLYPKEATLYLQTSPEFAMKRLLASGSGSIYQICKAFRNGEHGRYHNPEFTMLEWYRVGFNLWELMDEVSQLLKKLLNPYQTIEEVEYINYSEVFQAHTGLDPLHFDLDDYLNCAEKHNLPDAESICEDQLNIWLDFLFSHLVQPNLGKQTICMIYHFPACQSSLARLNKYNHKVTDRFEVFIDGVELANGYHELIDADEQKRRFEEETKQRISSGSSKPAVDQRLIAALINGLPDCSGVAIGLDRLLMIVGDQKNINKVLAFPVERA